MSTLLSIRDLGIAFRTQAGELPVTRGVSFDIARGERIGLVGESGCGKTVTGLAIMRLLPRDSARITGRIDLDGQDLAAMSEPRLRQVRGRDIAMIFQEPMSALDPVFTIGHQIAEAYRVHFKVSAKDARERAIRALDQVGIPLASRRCDEYPHQLSGGMRQRVMIAMALICEPRLLIADEPTTALDVTVQAQITDLLRDLSERTGTALLFITHDLGVVAEVCTRMVTMYAGEMVEDAAVDDALMRPLHPYTSGLLRSLPRLTPKHAPLGSIPGRVPSPAQMPAGCRFRDRCGYAQPGCEREQRMAVLSPQPATAGGRGSQARSVRCCRAEQLTLPGAVA